MMVYHGVLPYSTFLISPLNQYYDGLTIHHYWNGVFMWKYHTVALKLCIQISQYSRLLLA